MKKLFQGSILETDIISLYRQFNKGKSSFLKEILKITFSALFISISVNTYCGDYTLATSTINSREKSITIDFQQDYFYSDRNSHWQVDQFLLYEGTATATNNSPPVPDANKIYYWGCGTTAYHGYDIAEILSYTVPGNNPGHSPANATWKRIKWRNVPVSFNGKRLYYIFDNDADANDNCYDWNNSYFLRYANIPDYFYITPTIDYTASADDPDYIKINYTISNTAGANEGASYTIICYNGSNVEVVRKASTGATTGFFYVPVTNPSNNETFTLKVSTSLDIEGRTINHDFQRSVVVTHSIAPVMGTHAVIPCDGAIQINFEGSASGSIVERCENSSFSGATLISINVGTASSYTDNQDLTAGKTYYYRVRRWGKVYSATKTVKADFTPTKPDVPVLSELATGIKLDWNYTCGNVNQFIIMRKEKGQGGEIVLAEIPSSQQTYTDFDASSCIMYAYRIIAINEQDIRNSSDLSSYVYYSLDISNALSNLKVDKGYYPSKTSISWACIGLLDEFVILRKIYGSTDAPRQIISLDAKTSTSSGASRDYEVEDQTGDPGVVYEYTVRGMLSCAGNNSQSNDITGIGFRTPTGTVYGRITYSGGQVVQNVDVLASSDDINSQGSSFYFNGSDAYLKATDPQNSFADTAFTVQAWIRSDVSDLSNKTIFNKPGKYELGFDAVGALFFTDAVNRVTFSFQGFTTTDFTHITGVRASGKLLLYANDSLLASIDVPANTAVVNTDSIFIGRNEGGNYFSGYIDEVRLWNRALSKTEIIRDYTRLLAGNEKSLAAYWRFDEPVVNEFYDISYKNSIHNEHHGKVHNAVRSFTEIPTSEQLRLKGVTDDQGNYMISGIPYQGDGSIYTFRPRYGIHSFDPTGVNRIINAINSSYVLDFTDNSSFPIRVDVKFENSTYPVKGVGFKVDGSVVVLSDGKPAMTDDNGEVTLNVPIGKHSVQAYMANHHFVGNGYITTPTGADRNYQSAGTASLEDSTKVRVIGRLAGGAVQEALPVGFSQSTNNLGDNAAVTISLAGNKYDLTKTTSSSVVVVQYKPKQDDNDDPRTNLVDFNNRYVTVYPNSVTGEFAVNLIPVNFNVTAASVNGYGSLISQNIPLDLTSMLIPQQNIISWQDSITDAVSGNKILATLSDTVKYNALVDIIHRESPTIKVVQLQGTKALSFFGDTIASIPTFTGVNDTVLLYDSNSKSYLFNDRPVFVQGQKYKFRISVFESYKYNNAVDGVKDEVPSQDGTVEINNTMDSEMLTHSLQIDSLGQADYTFFAGLPDLTSGIKTIDLSAKVNNGTYVWNTNNPFIANIAKPGAFLLGSKSTGTNFITSGPDDVIMIIRDPHGSGSSTFVEKGSVIGVSSTLSTAIEQNFEAETTASLGARVVTWAGFGAGIITEIETKADLSLSVTTSTSSSLSGTTESTITLLSNFSTSDNENYVGHDGDLFVGNSTNLTYGACNNVTFVKKRNVSADDIMLWGYDLAGDEDYVLVSQKSISGDKSFGTMFIYPLTHIENVLIPNLGTIRDNIIEAGNGLSVAEAQAKADFTGEEVYVSKITKGDDGYGIPNIDSYWGANASDNNHYYDGPSYTIYFPAASIAQHDTILYLNQSIETWKARLADNEKAKIDAVLDKNYSFSSGSSISLSKQTDKAFSSSGDFTFVIGAGVGTEIGGEVMGIGMALKLNTSLSVSLGASVTTSSTNSYTTGFTLSNDEGYLSEDVCTAKDGSYVFKLKGGASACPYEGAYTSQYYKPGTVIDQPSMQMEVPKIAVIGSTQLSNIPSNKKGKFQLQLTNESESGDDATFTLKIDEASNPSGASFYLDGAPLGDGRTLLVRYGEPLFKTLEIGKGANAMEFNNLKLLLKSQCDDNIEDLVNVSVSYVPSCSDISLEFPLDKWVINTNTGETEENQIMNISVKAYDVNQSFLNSIVLEFKPSSASESAWTPIRSYFIDSASYKASPLQPANKEILAGGGISYDFKTYKLDNQYYDIRAKSICKIGAEDIISYTDIASGIKDVVRPRLFGSALPANGILTIKDEIQLNFNEDIADGLLSKSNFQVIGVINGSQGDHSASLYFDGVNDYVYTEAEKNMSGKSLTFEAWIKREKTGKATLFCHGNINNDFEFGFNESNQLEVLIGTQTITGTGVFTDISNWEHLAVVYDAQKNMVNLFHNFKAVAENEPVAIPYTGVGSMEFGRNLRLSDGYLAGQMHEARVWNKVVTESNLQINSLSMLSGGELGLLGYWQMTESKGTLAIDRANGANGIIQGALWYLDPRGKAVTLSGNNSSIRLETGAVVIKPDMEYSIELWFKGNPQSNTTLLSNGRGDGKDYNFSGTGTGSRDLIWIGFNENGELTVKNNGFESTVIDDFLDNDWHHLAFTVNRRGNAQILIDGELKNYFESANLGGLASPSLYVGARNYKDFTTGTIVQDQYFNGSIDEFRIWNLYLNQTLISKNNNVRLKGDEMGLMAYYPFDEYITFQGETFLQFTPEDMYAETIANTPVLTGAIESDDIAPIKGRGPVKTLDFDFVVNKDALIINLLQEKADIEKTIVTFTVDKIQDLNGNTIASPITWTAYIDRNQVKWENSELFLSKGEDEPLSFTEKINNIGGMAQTFSIENLPAWLTASITSGTIQPNSSTSVTFIVNDALNIGAYDHVIYLRNSDDVVEGLNLTMTVKGETPDWKVNAKDYKYSMSVYAKLRINNIFSKDPEDKFAAFAGNTCIGVSNVQYERRNDMWYAFLSVYSNQTTQGSIIFKIWDASTGKIYLADAGRTINFVNNSVVGLPSEPLVFDGKDLVYQNIELNTGWNWISFNVKSAALSSVNTTLDGMAWNSTNFFKSEADNISANYSEVQNKWIAEKPFELNNSLMYKVSTSVGQTISLPGTVVTPSGNPITVKANMWNYISYLPAVRLVLDEALAGYEANTEDVIKSQTGFAMYAKNIGWVGSLAFLEPNKGYMIYRNDINDVQFKYPDNSGSMSSKGAIPETSYPEFINKNYSANMNMLAISDIEPKANDRILAYIGDELSSVSTIRDINKEYRYFITIPGKENDPVTFALERNGEIKGQTTQALVFNANKVFGMLAKPFVLKFSENDNFLIYPNPVKDIMTISFMTQSSSKIKIRIIDVSGRTYINQNVAASTGGLSAIQINCNELHPGLYFVYLTVDDVTHIRKIVKQ